MVKTSKKSVGLLGGSFDHAHKGHLTISKIAIRNLKLNKVLWIITKQNPFKGKAFYSLSQACLPHSSDLSTFLIHH